MKRTCLLFISLWLGASAFASASMPPDQLVRETTDELLAEFSEKRELLEQNREKLFNLVDQIVVPHFDVERMSRYVLGQHWKDATPEQQKQFIKEFKTQLVRTYATALFEYSGDQDIIYKPFRHQEGDKRAEVKTEVPTEDGPSIPVEYRLILNNDQWQVYDVVIENISTVQNYRAQYGTVVQAQGIEQLIVSLSEKNKKLMSGAASE